MWFSGYKNQSTGSYINIHYSSIFQLKPIQNTTNITEITKISLKLGTSHTKQIQIDENFSPIAHSTKKHKNLALLTFLTIVHRSTK